MMSRSVGDWESLTEGLVLDHSFLDAFAIIVVSRYTFIFQVGWIFHPPFIKSINRS